MQIEFMPMFANAMTFALGKTTEGKITIGLLAVVSFFSWSVIIKKARQLYLAEQGGKKFFEAYRATQSDGVVQSEGGLHRCPRF